MARSSAIGAANRRIAKSLACVLTDPRKPDIVSIEETHKKDKRSDKAEARQRIARWEEAMMRNVVECSYVRVRQP